MGREDAVASDVLHTYGEADALSDAMSKHVETFIPTVGQQYGRHRVGITVNHHVQSRPFVQFLLPLHYAVRIYMVYNVIKSIDMSRIVATLTLVDEGPLIVRVTRDIDIRAIAGKNPVSVKQ